jgi:hypothetical protein
MTGEQLPATSIRVESETMPKSPSVLDLGVYTVADLSMRTYVKRTA